MAAAIQAEVSASRYGILLAQGTFYTAGWQLANVSAVLPFICAQQGIYWAAGLLYPAYSIGTVIGNAISPFVLERSRHLRHLVVTAATAAVAALIVCNAIAAQTEILVAGVFLVTSWAAGAANAISKVAISDVLSSKLPELRRGDVILTQGAVGSVAAILLTILVVPLVANRDPVSGHVDLLWLGAAGMAAAGIAAVFVGPVTSISGKATRGIRETYRDGIDAVRSQQWFRRYAVTQLVFVPISLGTTFFSLHASEQHGDDAGSLHVLVVFTSIGLIIGSVLWRIVYRISGVRGMLLTSALFSSAAALICIMAEAYGAWSHAWVHGIVFLLTTVANQAIFAAAISWINACAADRHRAALIGFGSMLVAIESTLLGAVLGGIAEKTSAIWPVTIVLALNVLATMTAARAPRRPVQC